MNHKIKDWLKFTSTNITYKMYRWAIPSIALKLTRRASGTFGRHGNPTLQHPHEVHPLLGGDISFFSPLYYIFSATVVRPAVPTISPGRPGDHCSARGAIRRGTWRKLANRNAPKEEGVCAISLFVPSRFIRTSIVRHDCPPRWHRSCSKPDGLKMKYRRSKFVFECNVCALMA